jgi:hypothetical protein
MTQPYSEAVERGASYVACGNCGTLTPTDERDPVMTCCKCRAPLEVIQPHSEAERLTAERDEAVAELLSLGAERDLEAKLSEVRNALAGLDVIRTVLAAYRSSDAHITEDQITAAWVSYDRLKALLDA